MRIPMTLLLTSMCWVLAAELCEVYGYVSQANICSGAGSGCAGSAVIVFLLLIKERESCEP